MATVVRILRVEICFLPSKSSPGPFSVTKRQERAEREEGASLSTLRDTERARTVQPGFWRVTRLLLSLMKTLTQELGCSFVSGQTDFKVQAGKCGSSTGISWE